MSLRWLGFFRVALITIAGLVLVCLALLFGPGLLAFVFGEVEEEVAREVLGAGGRVHLIVGEKLRVVFPEHELPRGRFLVHSVVLHDSPSIDALLPRLTELAELCELDVRGSQLGDPAMEHAGKLSELRSLNLAFTRVTDAGAERIGQLSRLRWLNLTGSGVGDAGMQTISQLPKLNHLLVGRTRVTDQGLEHLRGMRSLNSVDVRGTDVTAAGVAALRKALPDCRVLADRHIDVQDPAR